VFDHVTIRVTDRAASARFYDTVLRTLDLERTADGAGFVEWDEFSLAEATDAKPATRRLHVAFYAPSRETVDEFWRTGTAAGYRDDGEPGPRPQYDPSYYGAFLLDPDGNSVEAVHHDDAREGRIDHLWIRVADVDAARRFYEAVAPHTGFRLGTVVPDRVHFTSADGSSFGLVAGAPTEHAHLAFPAAADDTVDAFHRDATAAGHVDNGHPGERLEYHAGYYGAFVLDPDGNNVEVVNHNRR
jgi:catechol 2,3-dioxygenase-like lactoylglutathione lyase family enzyme